MVLQVEAELRADFAKQGIKLPDKDDTDTFDSNVITPGTPFMERLAMALQWCALLCCVVSYCSLQLHIGSMCSTCTSSRCGGESLCRHSKSASAGL